MGARHEASDQPSRQAQQWEKAKTYFGKVRDQLKYYWPCLLLLTIALVSYVAVLGYQARQPGDEAQYQVWDTWEIDWEEGRALLSVAYPRELRLETPGESRPISVWLQEETPTSGLSLTPTRTPTPTPTPTGMSISTTTTTLTLTPTVTSRPWVVAFSPHDASILFVDREGLPVAPQVALTPGAESAAPAVIYVQRAPLATEAHLITLNMSVYNPDATPVLAQALPSSISLESVGDAQCRHFWDLLCGPTTPLLVLAGSLISFAVGEWHRRSEQEREGRKRRVFAEVERLAYLRSQPREFILKYWELQERTELEPEWKNPDVIRRLDEILKESLSVKDLLAAAGKWFSELNDKKATRCTQLALSKDKESEIAQAFASILSYIQVDKGVAERLPSPEAERTARALNRISDVCDGKGKERTDRLLADLAKRQKWDKEKVESFAVSWNSLRWLELWPTVPPADSPAISNWLKIVGLKFNPFGPEAAELDPRLWRYRADAVFGQVQGRRPALLFGRPGFGKTAAALLLAYDCENPPSSPREAGAFPVYWSLPCNVLPDFKQHSYLIAATNTMAQAVARYLARRADSFLNLTEPQRYGVVQLLSLWTDSRERLEAELRHAGSGLGTPERLIREVTAIYQNTSYEQFRGDFPGLLAGALPAGFECLYLILDLSAAPDDAYTSAAKDLQCLVDLVIPLAAKGVYLKLFLPDSLRSYLGDVPACEVSTLTWSVDNLSAMLEARIQAAGGDSLAALCGPDVAKKTSMDVRLAQAAGGSPRQLVRLGNELLRTHVQRAPNEPCFSSQNIDTVLGPLDKAG